jgi:hypothetical protein
MGMSSLARAATTSCRRWSRRRSGSASSSSWSPGACGSCSRLSCPWSGGACWRSRCTPCMAAVDSALGEPPRPGGDAGDGDDARRAGHSCRPADRYRAVRRQGRGQRPRGRNAECRPARRTASGTGRWSGRGCTISGYGCPRTCPRPWRRYCPSLQVLGRKAPRGGSRQRRLRPADLRGRDHHLRRADGAMRRRGAFRAGGRPTARGRSGTGVHRSWPARRFAAWRGASWAWR